MNITDRSLKGLNEVVSFGAGNAKIKGESSDELKVVKSDESGLADLTVSELTVTTLVGATLAMLNAEIVNSLDSDSTERPLSAAQGKALKTSIDAINTLLQSDTNALDTLQEIVDFIENNKDLIDALDISNISGLQTALDACAKLSGGATFSGGALVVDGQDLIAAGGKLLIKTAASESDGACFDYSSGSKVVLDKLLELSSGATIKDDVTIDTGKTITGGNIDTMQARLDNELMRTSTITKATGSNVNLGTALAANSHFFEVRMHVTEVFNNNATVTIGTESDASAYASFSADDCSSLGVKVVQVAVKVGSQTQLKVAVNNGDSTASGTGAATVYIKPMM